MVVKENRKAVAAVLALVLFSLSGSAWARGLSRGGPFGLSGGVLEQLIYPCRADCRDTARDCSEVAESDAVTCVQNTCAAEIETAQSACADDRASEACRTAIRALRTCGASCLTTLKSAVTTCRDALHECVDACDAD